MDLKNLKIELSKKGGMTSASCDGVCHIKTLPYLSVVQATEGSYDIQLGLGDTYNTGEGGFFIAPKDITQTITHRANETSGKFTGRWLFLKAKANDFYSFDSLYDFPVILPDEYKAEMNFLFNKLFENCDIFSENIYTFRILKILHAVAKEKNSILPDYVSNAIAFIKEHYKEKLTAEAIAASVNLSQSYFFASFKKIMGVSPISYLNSFRLSMAEEMLINTEKAVNEISQEVGIEDSVYFNKIFRKAYQISPIKYRKKYKKII